MPSQTSHLEHCLGGSVGLNVVMCEFPVVTSVAGRSIAITATDDWATNQLGDNQLSDTHLSVNTSPINWRHCQKCVISV